MEEEKKEEEQLPPYAMVLGCLTLLVGFCLSAYGAYSLFQQITADEEATGNHEDYVGTEADTDEWFPILLGRIDNGWLVYLEGKSGSGNGSKAISRIKLFAPESRVDQTPQDEIYGFDYIMGSAHSCSYCFSTLGYTIGIDDEEPDHEGEPPTFTITATDLVEMDPVPWNLDCGTDYSYSSEIDILPM